MEKKRKLSSHKNPILEIKSTHKYGKGIFAGETIKKGRTIRNFTGEIISFDECTKRIKENKLGPDDALPIGDRLYIQLDRISYTFNHSCDPNAGFRKRSELFAIKNIKKDEEIVYDYSTTVGSDTPPSLWTMKCNCGSKKCRKILTNISSIPSKQLKKYIKARALQDHILKSINKIKNNDF